jgi:hypothetical protein
MCEIVARIRMCYKKVLGKAENFLSNASTSQDETRVMELVILVYY